LSGNRADQRTIKEEMKNACLRRQAKYKTQNAIFAVFHFKFVF
jgi:predicted  nucleic acid-binding Zn ribbon protein